MLTIWLGACGPYGGESSAICKRSGAIAHSHPLLLLTPPPHPPRVHHAIKVTDGTTTAAASWRRSKSPSINSDWNGHGKVGENIKISLSVKLGQHFRKEKRNDGGKRGGE